MLNNLSIRKKLALVALGPLLLLLVLSVIRIRGDLADTSDATDAQARTTASAATGVLFDALRVEAVENQNAVAISGLDLDGVFAETDAAIESWTAAVGEFSSVDGGALSSVVTDFNVHRREVAAEFATQSGAQDVFLADREVLRTVAQFDGLLSQGADPEAVDLRRAADLTTVSQQAAELQLLVMSAAHAGVVPDGLPGSLGASSSAADAYGLRSGQELPVPTGSYNTILGEFDGLSTGDAVGVSPNDWRAAGDARATQLRDARVASVRAASEAAADAQGVAQSAMRTSGLLALIGLVVAIAAIMLMARSIISALGALRDEAARVADTDLPALADSLSSGRPYVPAADEGALEKFGETEFGEVASGLTSIRESAAGLGSHVAKLQSGIAATYVNLARRNQALVERQLEAIDTLEAEERDSDRLALMYRVDHLATRMRRNAESLLVLADAKTPERHSSAVELREVLRVAIGEVEDYRRVIPIALDDLHVAGHRAQDLAHLLAELMENAAQHSPPGTAVDVSGAFEGASGDYIVTVLDHGTGVDAEQLEALNRLLSTPPASTLTISHSIGLHVVSRLAHSLGLAVALDHGTDSGLVASVRVPSSVVAEWAHTAPTPTRSAAPRTNPTAPVEARVAPAPVAEVFAPAAEPTMPEPVAPAPPDLAPPMTPPMAMAPVVDAPATGIDFGSTDGNTLLPDAPAVPTIDMPELDLPSFGAPEHVVSAESPEPPAAAPATEFVFETEPLASESLMPEMPPVVPQAPAPAADVFSTIDTPPVVAPPAAMSEPALAEMPTPQAPLAPEPTAPQPSAVEPPPVFEPQPQPAPEPPPVFEPQPQPAPEPVQAPASFGQPVAEQSAPPAAVTPSGLVKRQRQTTESVPQVDLTADRTAPSQRTPDQVKNMLSRYKTGLERGRGATETDGES